MFPINFDGSLAPACYAAKHEGSSVNSSRQKEPHAHCAIVDPSDKFVLFADLGIDQVVVYEIDRANKTLKMIQPKTFACQQLGPSAYRFSPYTKRLLRY